MDHPKHGNMRTHGKCQEKSGRHCGTIVRSKRDHDVSIKKGQNKPTKTLEDVGSIIRHDSYASTMENAYSLHVIIGTES